DWTGFRGPERNGLSRERDLPVKFEKDNLLWKIKLPGPGASSPITVGGRIFLTCCTGYGSGKDAAMEKLRLHFLCIDRKDGAVIWDREIAPKLPEATYNRNLGEHGYASSTPATDGSRIYVFFGKTGVIAFDLDGKQLWQTNVGDVAHPW